MATLWYTISRTGTSSVHTLDSTDSYYHGRVDETIGKEASTIVE